MYFSGIEIFFFYLKVDIINYYRSISIISVFSKILGALLSTFLTWQVQSKISKNQHGFIKNRSTISNLTVFVDNISKSLDNNSQVNRIYTDLSNAFLRTSQYSEE